MLEILTHDEEIKIKDFMAIYRKYLNPNCDGEIDVIVDCIFDLIIKVYAEYKDAIPFISVEDDSYSYYVLKPIDGQYCLLDYLINKVIQNLDSIELIDGKTSCHYNILKKKISINKDNTRLLHSSVFDTMKHKIDKDKYLELYCKHFIYHELCHMLHYKINGPEENTIYVPLDYLASSTIPQKNWFGRKRRKENDQKQIALDKIKNRISMYSCLKNKYNVLVPEEIDECSVAVEKPRLKYEEIFVPPFLYQNPVEEAFADCEAQVYSGIFENKIFDTTNDGILDCFYLPIDDEHVLMTYCPTGYSFSASIAFALKDCISKQSYFRTFFLGKPDFFIDFLGDYDLISVVQFSNQLIDANKGKISEVQPLLDAIINFREERRLSSKNLNIYFPLVLKDNRWNYYMSTVDKDSPKVLRKNNKN